ncbi:MAG TPA: TIGR03086 family metal-binding protein [Amycolatopsis sp.]|nr:TIGR03086 family metal-binding protein [Amycolatopsis sp.]
MKLLDAHRIGLREFDQAVHQVEPGQWDAPTPCTGWTVRDLVNHLVSEQLWAPHLLGGATLAEVGDRYDGDVLGADPVAAWESSSTAAREAWTAPGATERRVHLSFGESDAEDYGWQMIADLAVHGWDLAVAIGAVQPIRDDLADTVLRVIAPQVPTWQGIGIFEPPVPVAGDAPPADHLVALLGRDPGLARRR